MIRALSLVVLISFGAHAAEPADAPLILEAGQLAPSRGLFKPEAKAIRDEAAHVACDAERVELRKSAGVAWWVPVIVGVVAVGAGVSLGVGISEARR